MTTAIADAPLEATPGLPDDDVKDPVVPPEALAPLPGPTLQQVRDDLRAMARATDVSMDRLPGLLETHMAALGALLAQQKETLSAVEAGALQHLVDTLDTLGARGLVVSGSPYAATVTAKTPAGFAISVTLQRTDGAVFLEALGNLEKWLTGAGYTPAL